MSGAALRAVGPLDASEIPSESLEFLRLLGGPVAIRVDGRDHGRCRVLVTLLHGNEPSGFFAIHAWLRGAAVPATDVLIILGGANAALVDPPLSSRLLPDGTDLNRCFWPGEGHEPNAQARAILELIESERPEALVDIHNNTGHNPAYGVVTRDGLAERCLVALFARRFVNYDLRLGALVEMSADVCPSVVVEVGRAGDPHADQLALDGVARFLGRKSVIDGDEPPPLDAFARPVRVELARSLEVAFGSAARSDVDLTVDEEIDRHNFEVLPAGTTIGWVGRERGWPLVAIGADGRDRSRELFALERGRLSARRDLVPIMMTTDALIARSDCLFYVVEADSASPARAAARRS